VVDRFALLVEVHREARRLRLSLPDMGIDALFYLRIFQNGLEAGMTQKEAGWILEDNWSMRRGLERLGAYAYKTYRVFGTRLR
jgi:hypothetical protein